LNNARVSKTAWTPTIICTATATVNKELKKTEEWNKKKKREKD
jgi:hypothetical protein